LFRRKEGNPSSFLQSLRHIYLTFFVLQLPHVSNRASVSLLDESLVKRFLTTTRLVTQLAGLRAVWVKGKRYTPNTLTH